MLHASKYNQHILEPSTEHTGLGLLYCADIPSIFHWAHYSKLPTYNMTTYKYIHIWQNQASSSSNSTLNITDMKRFDVMSRFAQWLRSRLVSRRAPFDYQQGHRLYWPTLSGLFFSHCRVKCHNCFVSNCSKFTIHQAWFQLMLCCLRY
jgi:hypothetical protein